MPRCIIIVMCLLFGPAAIAGRDTLCVREMIFALANYNENKAVAPKGHAFLELKNYHDQIESPGYYAECKKRSNFWIEYAELNYVMGSNSVINYEERLKYLESARIAGETAVAINDKTVLLEDKLPLIMYKTLETESDIYFNLKDSANFKLSTHRRDSVLLRIHPNQARNDSEATQETANQTSPPTPALSPQNNTVYSAEQLFESVFIEVLLFDEHCTPFMYDTSSSVQITASDFGGKQQYTISNQQNGAFVLKVPPFKTFLVEVKKDGYVSQARKFRSDGQGEVHLIFYMAPPSVPYYYVSNDTQFPYKKNDKLISIYRNQNYPAAEFNTWIKSLGIVRCTGDSFYLFRKISGQDFDSYNDSVLFVLRSSPGKVLWAGPILSHNIENPLILLNRIRIVFIAGSLTPEEKNKLDSILSTSKLKQEDGWYTAPPGTGIGLNEITDQLNKLPFILYAFPETIAEARGK
jgi:hypothetical protein